MAPYLQNWLRNWITTFSNGIYINFNPFWNVQTSLNKGLARLLINIVLSRPMHGRLTRIPSTYYVIGSNFLFLLIRVARIQWSPFIGLWPNTKKLASMVWSCSKMILIFLNSFQYWASNYTLRSPCSLYIEASPTWNFIQASDTCVYIVIYLFVNEDGRSLV